MIRVIFNRKHKTLRATLTTRATLKVCQSSNVFLKLPPTPTLELYCFHARMLSAAAPAARPLLRPPVLLASRTNQTRPDQTRPDLTTVTLVVFRPAHALPVT